ncbi:MAG: hypothetical protein ACRD1C_03460 [Terriglobales bacterium]
MRCFYTAAVAALALGCALSQSPAPSLPAGTIIQAELRTQLNTARAKIGEAVQAQTTANVTQYGQKILPKGSKLIGHIVAVTPAESPKSPSQITIVFTQVATKHGAVVPLHTVITGLRRIVPPAPPVMMSALPQPHSEQQPDRSNGTPTATLGEMPMPTQVTGANGSMNQLEQQTNLQPIRIRSTAKGGSVLTSIGNLKLERGTQLQLREIATPLPQGPHHRL